MGRGVALFVACRGLCPSSFPIRVLGMQYRSFAVTVIAPQVNKAAMALWRHVCGGLVRIVITHCVVRIVARFFHCRSEATKCMFEGYACRARCGRQGEEVCWCPQVQQLQGHQTHCLSCCSLGDGRGAIVAVMRV